MARIAPTARELFMLLLLAILGLLSTFARYLHDLIVDAAEVEPPMEDGTPIDRSSVESEGQTDPTPIREVGTSPPLLLL